MRVLKLERFFYGDSCTMGTICWGGNLIYTMEDAWKNNAIGQSCIPDGTYRCEPRIFHRGGYPAIEITGVPNRTHILIHRANTAADVQGCIAIGRDIRVLSGLLAVGDSSGAWGLFHPEWGHEPFDLVIFPMAPLVGTRKWPA